MEIRGPEDDPSSPPATDDYYSGDYLQDMAEARLIELGGQHLLGQAHDYAGANADLLHPWDGIGVEPEARVSEYIASLWAYIEAVESRGE